MPKCPVLLYVFVGPIVAFMLPLFLAVGVSYGLQRLIMPDDPALATVSAALTTYLKVHKKQPVYLFDKKLVAAVAPIEKGQTITYKSVAEYVNPDPVKSPSATNADDSSADETNQNDRVALPDEVVGGKASRQIKSGQLVGISDVEPVKSATPSKIKSEPEGDFERRLKADPQISFRNNFSAALSIAGLVVALLLGGAGFLCSLISQVWLIIEAFKSNVLWGLGYMFVPLVSLVFDLKHWQISRRPFNLFLIGLCLLSAGLGAFLGNATSKWAHPDLIKLAQLEVKLSKKASVVYTVKKIPAGSIVSAECLQVRELEESKIPMDCIKSVSAAVGRTCRYGLEPGQIVSQADLVPRKKSVASSYVETLQNAIKANWHVDKNERKSRNAVARFSVEADGRISGVHLTKSSGSKTFDQSVYRVLSHTRGGSPPESLSPPVEIEMYFGEKLNST